MKSIICALATLITSAAFAYTDGTYNCKNADASLPDRVVKISTVNIGGVAAPFVEMTRSFRNTPNGPIETSEVKGFASSHKSNDSDVLMVAALRLEFDGDTLLNCKTK
jgi:hypothetical protein